MPLPTAKWRLGLRLLSVVILGTWAAMLVLRSLPKIVDGLDAQATAEFREFVDAAQRGEHDEAWAARDRFDDVMDRVELIAGFVLVVNVSLGVGLLVFIGATWLVTSGSEDRWERYARLGAIVAPIIVLASTVPEGRQTASLLGTVCGFIVCFGHERAYRRIATMTGQLATGRTIQLAIAWMLLGVLIVTAVALVLLTIGQARLVPHLAPLTLAGGTMAIACISILLWRLGTGIVEPLEQETV